MDVTTSEIIAFYIIIVMICLAPFISAYFICHDKGGWWEGKQ